jgi:hypothetical protein
MLTLDQIRGRFYKANGIQGDLATWGWNTHRRYAPEALVEYEAGYWDESANEIGDLPSVEISHEGLPIMPPLRDCLFDQHTNLGVERFAGLLRKCYPGLPLPAGIDLRWTGSARGEIWRELAFNTKGPPAQKWEEVEIYPYLWNAACALDHFRWPRLRKL